MTKSSTKAVPASDQETATDQSTEYAAGVPAQTEANKQRKIQGLQGTTDSNRESQYEMRFQSSSPTAPSPAALSPGASPAQPVRYPGLILQLHISGPKITPELLASETKSIYQDLLPLETKCIQIHKDMGQTPNQNNVSMEQNTNPKTNLSNDHFQALTALHRTLLHHHIDFFMATQHPLSSSKLRQIAAKYGMVDRMWRHGCYEYLQLLDKYLPEALEHMLSFVHLARGVFCMLHEIVPAFRGEWDRCAEELERYRVEIEDDGIDMEDF